jgi:glycine hydroxymethyltransferase
MSALLDSAVFPGTQGGPLEHVIAGKAVAFGEALEDSFMDYTLQVMKNSKLLGEELIKRGFDIISGGTDNHCVLINLNSKDITGKEAERVLGLADITVNKNMVPFDTRSPFVTSGIRIGTPAITTRGITEKEIPLIAELIDRAISNKYNEEELNKVKKEVNKLMEDLPLFNY